MRFAEPDGRSTRAEPDGRSTRAEPDGRGTRAPRIAVKASACLLGLATLGVLGAVLPLYWVYLLSTVAVSALIARGIGVVTNRAGIITLCQMSFAAIGGWIVSWLALASPNLPFPLLVVVGGAATAPVGLLLGLVTARIRGVELAVVTLGFAAALDLVLRQGGFPGVGSGTPVIPAAPFDDSRSYFALAWAFFIVLQIGIALLGRTKYGLSWTAVRTSERAAAALGVRVGAAKSSAFAVGALCSGIAGGMLAGQYGLLTTSVFTPLTSMVHLATAVLCGASLFGGAVLAGVFTVFVPEGLRRLGLPLDVGNALLAFGAFDALRRGTGGIAEQLQAKVQDHAFRDARTACTFAPLGGAETHRRPRSRDSQTNQSSLSDAPCLEVSALSVVYGENRVIDEIDLAVHAGEVHALIGSNGAGKTTLVDAVTGFLPEYAGTVRLASTPIDRLTARARAERGVRRTFQQSRAVEAFTVGQYLRLSAGRTDPDRVRLVSEFFGLPDARVPVRLMDGGSRRVLEIAASLAAAPSVLLLDEPAAGLASEESRVLADRVRRIPAEFGCAVLLIEHDMSFVRGAANLVTVLDHGRVIATGEVNRTLAEKRVIAAYLGEEVAR